MKLFTRDLSKNIWASLPGQALAASLLFSLISISLAEGFLFLAIVLWAVWIIKDKRPFRAPTFFIPLLVFSALSLAAAAFSVNQAISFYNLRQLALYLIIPVAYMSLGSIKEIGRANLAVFVSAAVSMVYSFYHFVFKAAAAERIKGFMGHYMTQSGLLVLFVSLALAMLFFERRKIRWLWGAGAVTALAALELTLTRSAWIGLAVALFVLVFLYKPKFVLAVPVLVVIVFFASPAPVKQRALSIFTLQGFSNRIRVEYFRTGLRIIRDFPLFGTGPDTVDMVFQNPKYGLSEEAKRNVHLHNTPVQIAAERGIPALLAWLAFIVWVFLELAKLIRVFGKGRQQTGGRDPSVFPLAAAALAGLAAFVVSGLFEYNFGDSEILVLFLFLMTVPFATIRGQVSISEKNDRFQDMPPR
jgi:O-antigen ligase